MKRWKEALADLEADLPYEADNVDLQRDLAAVYTALGLPDQAAVHQRRAEQNARKKAAPAALRLSTAAPSPAIEHSEPRKDDTKLSFRGSLRLTIFRRAIAQSPDRRSRASMRKLKEHVLRLIMEFVGWCEI